MKNLLEATRQKLGPAPRVVRGGGTRFAPPSWIADHDPLYTAYLDTDLLLEHGDVVWGHLIQANGLLFSPGTTDCPGDVLFAPDRSFDGHIDRLERAAAELFELKGTAPSESAYQRIADHLRDERARAQRMPVPVGIARGASLFVSTLLIHRRALPLSHLGTSALPLLVSEHTPTVIALPAALWAEDLLEAWRDVAAEPSD